MNLLFSFLTICMATVVIGLPQNYGSGGEIGQSLNGKKPELPKLSEGCRIQYKTVYDIVEKDIIEKKCTEKYRWDSDYFLTFPAFSKSQYFFPIWILIVLIY